MKPNEFMHYRGKPDRFVEEFFGLKLSLGDRIKIRWFRKFPKDINIEALPYFSFTGYEEYTSSKEVEDIGDT